MSGHLIHELGCSEPCTCGAVDRVIAEPECIHGVWPPTSCSICNGRENAERAVADAISHRFTARFDGHCGKCGQPTLEGDWLAATNDGRYLCEDCAP